MHNAIKFHYVSTLFFTFSVFLVSYANIIPPSSLPFSPKHEIYCLKHLIMVCTFISFLVAAALNK